VTTTETAAALGDIVLYRLGEQDALVINRRRDDARRTMPDHHDAANGVQLHIGNGVQAGDVYPMVITRVWGGDSGSVNGQVQLDGADLHWVTSVLPGDGPQQYRARG
jgi:hypothetical protein